MYMYMPLPVRVHVLHESPADRYMMINCRCMCAVRVSIVGSVCLSVKSHLTYGVSVRPENAVTYSAGNEGEKNLWGFLFVADIQHFSHCMAIYLRPFFVMRKNMHALYTTACACGEWTWPFSPR